MTTPTTPRDPRARFSGRAQDYARWRPRYPAALVDTLRDAIGLGPHHVIADVGSGTGISAEPFLRNGNPVFGVEPNAEMRRAAEQALAGYPGFRSVDGSAEATGLPEASVDVVLAAQAFHWFDRARARGEFSRILRSPGWLVLVWNQRLLDGPPFQRALEELLREFGTDYDHVRHDKVRPDEVADFFGGPCGRASLPNRQVLDLEGLLGRVRSASYMPVPGDPRYAPMVRAVERLFAAHQHEGRVAIEYDTEVYYGRLR